MNAHSKGMAIAADAAPSLSCFARSPSVSAVPASIDYRGEWREVRDRLTAEQLRTIELRGKALRLAWAMRGLCREAEKHGVDVTYWRDLARDAEESIG